jgi:hypothetical protein
MDPRTRLRGGEYNKFPLQRRTSWLATGFFIGKNLSGFADTLAKLVKGIDKALE